jgi:hypothetical protein
MVLADPAPGWGMLGLAGIGIAAGLFAAADEPCARLGRRRVSERQSARGRP